MQIENYLQQLPHNGQVETLPDGEVILKAIEAQHGILVECAHDIYSFSHLTFQEYFTARYIIENAIGGSISRLIWHYLMDNRWNEVFQLTASMLDTADEFFDIFLVDLPKAARKNPACWKLLKWANKKSSISYCPGPGTRIALLSLARATLSRNTSLVTDNSYIRNLVNVNMIEQQNERTVYFALALEKCYNTHGIERKFFQELISLLGIPYNAEELNWTLKEDDDKFVRAYLSAIQLLVDCLGVSVVSNRPNILEKLCNAA